MRCRRTHSVVAIVNVGTQQKSLLVPIEITAERIVNGTRMDVNTISSIYEKPVETLVNDAIALENSGEIGIFYAKKEATALSGAGVQFPIQLQQLIASHGIIHRLSEKVNRKISNVTQSQQFKQWFGDWQNDPKDASKAVNEDGTPKLFYHGTSRGGFTVFDTYGGNFGLFGVGSYFTENPEVAESYTRKGRGDNPQVYPVYLNIRNPLDMDADANVSEWEKAAPDADSYFSGCKTNAK